MNPFKALSCLLACLILFLGIPAYADAQSPDGSYRLVSRTLPDGTVLTPPAVQGMGTFKNGTYQLTIFWKTPDGKPASLSRLSEWEWHENEVIATPLVFFIDDGIGKPVYEWGGQQKRVPIIRQGTRISHQHPLDPVYMVWDGDRQTATIDGVLEDHWERAK